MPLQEPNAEVRKFIMTEFERLRIEAGLTVAKLCREAEISRSTVEKIEKDIPVRAPFASRACKVLSHHLEREINYVSIGIRTV
jgi:transcriptional regulator with XRE-family HTH domain